MIAHAPPAAHEGPQRPSYSINGILGLQSVQQQQDHTATHKRKRDENGKFLKFKKNIYIYISEISVKILLIDLFLIWGILTIVEIFIEMVCFNDLELH